MVRSRRSLIVQIIVTFIGLSVVWAESEVDAQVADCFEVRWSSVSYNKTIYNPAASSQGREDLEKLSLSCEIEILDPNRVLGMCREPVIGQLTDSEGQYIDASQAQPRSALLFYQGLRYGPQSPRPPSPRQSEALVQSVATLPGRPRGQSGLVFELEPSRMRIELDPGLCELAGGEIGRVEGHFYALMAESLERVEVPFEPNDNWVRLTPDLEIQVRKASHAGRSYEFEIATNPERAVSMQPLIAGGELPSRIVVAQELIEEDGKPRLGGLHRSLPAPVGGGGGGSGGGGRIEKIRYVIALNPTHHEIPFELEHIPLPNLVRE